MLKKQRQLVERHNFPTSELINLLSSHDSLVKKLTCDYISDKAIAEKDLGLLCANILLRDCADPNPSVRSSSLLALASLPTLVDASIPAVLKALNDSSPQVRRAASHGCSRIYTHSKDELLESDVIDALYKGIRDPDPIYVVNCLMNLEKILESEGGVVINKNIARYLFEDLNRFSSCDVVYVFNILKKYRPKSSEEVFSFLNCLDSFLSSTKASVLMAAIDIFLHLTSDYPNLMKDLMDVAHPSVCKVIKYSTPEVCLFTLESLFTFTPEMLKHFSQGFKCFLPKPKEPRYLKLKKLEFLPLIVNEDNAIEIIADLKHCTIDTKVTKEVFRCLGQIGTIGCDAERDVVTILTHVIKTGSYVSVESALECLVFLLLSKETLAADLQPKPSLALTHTLLNNVGTAICKPAIIDKNPLVVFRILQALSPSLSNVQDLIEEVWKYEGNWDDRTTCIFITTVSVCFLHHPSVFQMPLSSILSNGLKSSSPAVRDHSAFVYACLEEGPVDAFKLLSVSRYYALSDICS